MAGEDTKDMTQAERIFVRISVLQTFLAVAGLFTGAVALWAAVNEADAVRKQQLATVWPYISVSPMNYGSPGEERFEIIVRNKGIGPARIKSVRLEVDGKEETSWYDLAAELSGGKQIGISNTPIANEVISPEEELTAVSFDVAYAPKEAVFGFRDLVRNGRANIFVCYCSVFDDCWRLDALNVETSPVDSCPPQNAASNI
ncbi:MAG: hypothetical protein GC152_11125 [Alphaproteobacteria bacterium]|nr:hypothetical protein [Alphaproteobacteria bacterium]